MILLVSAGYGGSQVREHLLRLHLVFLPVWGGVILAFSSFFSKIHHQKESEIMVGIFSPT